MKFIDETGNTYGYLTVIERGPNQGTRASWKCRCKCGNELYVIGKNLRNGNTKSCGCLHKEIMQQKRYDMHLDMIGQIYGNLEVIDYGNYAIRPDGRKDQKMLCKCLLCGKQIEVRCSDLRLGNQSSCGCSISRGNTKIYSLLQEKNISFKAEYRIDECRDIRPLPFDFAFFDINDNLIALLEYQGIQHFTCENHGWDRKDKFDLVQKHDLQKYNYCKSANIKLYYITYEDNIEEKIKEILDELYSG